ncbi:MAG: hypothetical protein JW786_07925 [Desulfobacterales bacterium]|nr:hypothetical protein [Desulfobacterales bacterium]
MFKPEKLIRITIQVPLQFISAVTATLTRFKLLHLVRISETYLGHLGYTADTDEGLIKKFEELFKEVKFIIEALAVRAEQIALQDLVIPEKDIFRIKDRLKEVKKAVEPTLNSLKIAGGELVEKKALSDKISFLPADFDFSRLKDCRFVSWMIGLVPARGLEKLEESLAEVHHAFTHIGTFQQRAVIMVFGLKKDESILERALKGAFFEKIDIPARISGTAGKIIADIQSQIETLEEKKKRLSLERESFKKKYSEELLIIKEKIIAARNILTARRFFGKIDKSYLISGWIPIRLFEKLKETLTAVTEGQVIFEKVDSAELREMREGVINIPILFNNPMLISPFEKLTRLYGTPRYKEVEPTIFFALSFLLMFGMMFGDVGHGIVLFIVGHIIFRRFYKYMDYGVILMECGIVSAIFGFLYGSLFGLDNVIPALWFRPLNNISYFMKVALGVGIFLVSLGFILNLINALRLSEYEGLLSASGLAGALFYWMLIGVGVKYFFTGHLAPHELSVFGWVAGLLITIIVLNQPLYRLLFKRQPIGKIIKQKGLLTEIVESVVQLFDDIIRYLSNTISFIRLAAFALAHAALFLSVFSIADLVAHEKGGGLFYWLVVTAGNAVIILLEGLVVSIQIVRLEYYEFFTKFFRGGGEQFKSFDHEIDSEKNNV